MIPERINDSNDVMRVTLVPRVMGRCMTSHKRVMEKSIVQSGTSRVAVTVKFYMLSPVLAKSMMAKIGRGRKNRSELQIRIAM